jgi:hypothetical protein
MKTSLIITSIASSENKALNIYAEGCKRNDWKYIVIGDTKSPELFEIDGCDFYSIKLQLELPYKSASILPTKHYSRKNLGYLVAVQGGADIIVETDDDNFPFEDFWKPRDKKHLVMKLDGKGWTNVYSYFTKANIWPRGLPLEELQKNNDLKLSENLFQMDCPIQQGLADQNPDVDAVFRLVLPLPLDFDKSDSVYLSRGVVSPFNSQNTTWFKETFPLLYLPSYCSFRMTDIWRSFVATRIAWTCGWGVMFHNSSVYQERNEHNLLKDFEDEIPGYLNNNKIMKVLIDLQLKDGREYIYDNLLICYKALVEHGWITDKKELELVEAWISDLKAIGI